MTGNAIEYSNRMRSVIVFVLLLLICSGCSRKRAEGTPLTAADSLKSMRLSEEFHVELFASEPQVMSPVEMVFDDDVRIYVAEMMDYPDDPPAGKPARSRIRLLEDTDGDGKPDRVTVFADNVLAVSGIMPWKGGLIVTSAPDILYMKDDNGDGVADTRKALYTGFPRVNSGAPDASSCAVAGCQIRMRRSYMDVAGAASGSKLCHCGRALESAMRIMACNTGEPSRALLKTHGFAQAICGAHDFEFVFPARVRRVVEVDQEVVQALPWTKRVRRPAESRNGLGQLRAGGLEVALLAHTHLQFG